MGNYLQKKYLDEFKYIKSLKNMPDTYFVNGRKVRVINCKDYVKFIQSSYGGWDETMSECMNQICTVVTVDHDKTILLNTPSQRHWLFSRAALEPLDFKDYDEIMSFSLLDKDKQNQKPNSEVYLSIPEKIVQPSEHPIKPDTQNKPKDKKQAPMLMREFKVGDLLRVSSNEKLVQEKQQDCGGYSKVRMQDLVGSFVCVKHFSARCVKVEKDGKDYDLHPDILDYPKSGSKVDMPPKKNSNNMEKNTHLFAAITDSDLDKLLQIIDKDTLDVQNNVGRTPINLACCLGKEDMVDYLISFYADLNIPDNNGNLPVHNCAIKGHEVILKKILEKFPDQINKHTQGGLSLLTIAKQKKNKDLESFLLTKNIDIINPISHPASNSLEISLPYPPTTLTHNTDETHILQIRYSSLAPGTLMDPPKDESNTNNSRIMPEFETIAVPSIPIFRPPSMPNKSNLSMGNQATIENECTICRDGKMNVAFVKCGHLACKKCADRIFKCHICNSEIEGKIVIYL